MKVTLPEPEYVSLKKACRLLECDIEDIVLYLKQGVLTAYVKTPSIHHMYRPPEKDSDGIQLKDEGGKVLFKNVPEYCRLDDPQINGIGTLDSKIAASYTFEAVSQLGGDNETIKVKALSLYPVAEVVFRYSEICAEGARSPVPSPNKSKDELRSEFEKYADEKMQEYDGDKEIVVALLKRTFSSDVTNMNIAEILNVKEDRYRRTRQNEASKMRKRGETKLKELK